ncbi:hypothetical protein [Aurantiacibacter sp. D1-12]|uniref:hypothetical protein n=1 Tax=Aurantiacibacter sp. D1-12 TaxID=2993658 RepID=UPI00237CF677|nr:hypothetical protein [Aurantiacibacter sp. D1-12]MDE1468492.1 hypothetical protein [Aurantiacibacter sp. D1-12]
MIAYAFALATGLIGVPAIEDCPAAEASTDGHLSDVCAALPEVDVAYSATMRASLNPRPASQQVMVYRMEGQWFVRTAGYRWTPGTSVVTTRRNDLPIAPEDASMIETRLSQTSLSRLAELPYYGADDVICTDGSNLEIAAALDGARFAARQHSCAGQTELNEIAALFRGIAIKYDSEFEGYLSGL